MREIEDAQIPGAPAGNMVINIDSLTYSRCGKAGQSELSSNLSESTIGPSISPTEIIEHHRMMRRYGDMR